MVNLNLYFPVGEKASRWNSILVSGLWTLVSSALTCLPVPIETVASCPHTSFSGHLSLSYCLQLGLSPLGSPPDFPLVWVPFAPVDQFKLKPNALSF